MPAVLFSDETPRAGALGNEEKGGPQNSRSEGTCWRWKRQRGNPRVLRRKELCTRSSPPGSHAHPPRPRVYLPWEMNRRFGGGRWFDLPFFFFFLLIHLSVFKTRKETRPGQEEQGERWRVREEMPSEITPSCSTPHSQVGLSSLGGEAGPPSASTLFSLDEKNPGCIEIKIR